MDPAEGILFNYCLFFHSSTTSRFSRHKWSANVLWHKSLAASRAFRLCELFSHKNSFIKFFSSNHIMYKFVFNLPYLSCDNLCSLIYRYTQNNRTQPAVIYASLLSWPRTNLTLAAPVPSANTTVTLVGYKGPAFQWLPLPTQGLQVVVPNIHLDDIPCQWAWVLKLTNILN